MTPEPQNGFGVSFCLFLEQEVFRGEKWLQSGNKLTAKDMPTV
jgi:hypothetical protein